MAGSCATGWSRFAVFRRRRLDDLAASSTINRALHAASHAGAFQRSRARARNLPKSPIFRPSPGRRGSIVLPCTKAASRRRDRRISRWRRRSYGRDCQHLYRPERRVPVRVDPVRVPAGAPPSWHRSAPGRQRQCGRRESAAEHHEENRRERDGARRRQGHRQRAGRAADRSGHHGAGGRGHRRRARPHLSRLAGASRRQRRGDDVRRVFDSCAAGDGHRDAGVSRARSGGRGTSRSGRLPAR